MAVTISSIIVLLLALALAFYALSRRESSAIEFARKEYGIPNGRVIYSDLDRPGRPLFSRRFGISGKPDYIIRDKGGAVIPVELKSGRVNKPYRGHVLQLAAYCLLVEETYSRIVPYGIIVYGDGRQHIINFDDALRSDLLSTVEDMRVCWAKGHPARRHNLRGRCSSCSLRKDCRYYSVNNKA